MASMKGHSGPVVVKRLKEANPDIYRLLCHARNPHIPEIYEVETDGTDVLVAEEHVDGSNLEEYLAKQMLSDDAKLKLALQLCEAVEFLHAMEPPIIHRDIKPSNILINGKGVLKLIDFDASRNYKENQSSGDTRLLGTVEYAPPEQFGYSQTDVRSDIYSMGVVFHEMTLREDEKRIAEWTKLVDTCTNFDPKNRFQSVAELKKEIEKLIAWKQERRKKLAVRISLIILVMVVVGASVLTIRKAIENSTAQNTIQNDAQNAEQKEVQDAEQNQPVEQTLESGLIEQTGEFYYEYPQDVTAALNSNTSGQINALYLRYTTRPENPELQRLQAWCYEIAEDGTSILIKKEYLSEIRKDIGQLNLVVACDDGSLYELAIHVLEGLPEGVPAGTVAEEIIPVEIPESRTELYPNMEKAPIEIRYSYYKSARTEFIIPDDKYRAYEVFDYATCYCYQTGLAVDIPEEMLTLEEGYVVVAQQFMMSLEPYVYEFCFYYTEPTGESSVVEKTFKVYPEETEVLSTGFLLLKSEQTVYTGISRMVTNVVRNGKRSKLDACYVLNQKGEKEYLGGRNESGRICWVPIDQVMPYFDQGTVTLYIRFDTGEISEMTIKLVEGMPEWLQEKEMVSQEPSEEPSGEPQEEYSEEIITAMRSAGSYYKALAVKPALIFCHRLEQPKLEKVLCYNYMTEQTWEVPADMLDAGAGYLSVSGKYVHTLEPALYRFTFVEAAFEAEMNMWVYSESELSPEMPVEKYFLFEPVPYGIGVLATVQCEVPCRFTGVSVERNGEVVQVGPEGYDLACDGRYMLVKREFLMPYKNTGTETIVTIIYQFDDGSQLPVEIDLKKM